MSLDKTLADLLHKPAAEPLFLEDADACALPPNFQIVDIERFLPAPHRIRERIVLHTQESFVAYVRRFARPGSVLFVNPNLTGFGADFCLAHAVLDYHAPANSDQHVSEHPSWTTHTAEFHPQPSPAYSMLGAIDGKLLPQDEFAQHLRDLTRFCTSHPAADLLETVRTLTLTSRGEFASFDDDVSGSVRLKYEVQVEASAGTAERALTIPSGIEFSLPVFLGGDALTITAELLYRTPRQAGAKVQLGLRLPDRLWLEHDLIQTIATRLAADTGLLALTGQRSAED